ncbi:MAG: ribonuclease III [Clostridiaceae bacterium]|nr:ribonuclease III [Clostridiaceae bacterium]
MRQSFMDVPFDIEKLSVLEDRLDYHFSRIEYLFTALTHSSYAYESRDPNIEDNERLEFLGDGILDFVIAEELFRRKTKRDEGYLSKTRALIVCESMLAEIAEKLDVGIFILLGHGEDATGGRRKPSNLSNAMEAIFAAIYLDGGYEAAKKAILGVLNHSIDLALKGSLVFDYKSRLLEWAQSSRARSVLSFSILDEYGPVHDRTYRAAVCSDEGVVAEGIGRSKKLAEQDAARNALDVLNIE